MVRVEIDLPRPFSLLFWSGAVIAAIVYYSGGSPATTTADVTADAEGGSGKPAAVAVQQAEEDGKALRIKREVLSRREDILRAELEILESEYSADPEIQDQLIAARERLAMLLLNKQEAEHALAESLEQIWEAQGYAMRLSSQGTTTHELAFRWPVEPSMGVSAFFDDAAYQKRFGFPHEAVDIPAPYQTVINAPAPGTVMKVTDNGLGFNSLIIKHDNGMTTLYGHVSTFLVSEGDDVQTGEAIALSGGTPGTPGAGHMTTGPHLHFQILKDGVAVDPLKYLPNL